MTYIPLNKTTSTLRPATAGIVATLTLASTMSMAAPAEDVTSPAVVVTGILMKDLEGIPGSTWVLPETDFTRLQPPTVKEVLRTVPGVHVVDEDALGVNLNIGLRGLDPRRSSRTLLLEDGAPIHLAPYSDPSAHYHPPAELIEQVEVLKGSGQIVHGPQTVGGVINFLTRRPPAEREARLRLAAGNRGFGSVYARYGDGNAELGGAIDFLHKRIDGSRDKYEHAVTDLALSGRVELGGQHKLLIKGGHYIERSKTAEWGLTQARFDANSYGNPFNNDIFELDRTQGQIVYEGWLSESLALSTRFYAQRTSRTSYRQIDDSTDRMTAGAAGSGCTSGAQRDSYDNADRCGNKQRPRDYFFWGVEPRLDAYFNALGAENHLVAGLRYHDEDITRKRFNGNVANAREDTPGTQLRDWNEIQAQAWSLFAQNTFTWGALGVTPGVRFERIESNNRAVVLNFNNDGRSLKDSNSEVLPGLGLTYKLAERTSLFAGVHKGFAPPRPDANLSPVDPDLVPVEPETSTNYELGARTQTSSGFTGEATLFRIEFDNQIVPGDSVGLPLQTFANAGETLHQGVELGWRWEIRSLGGAGGTPYISGAYTYLFDAEFSSDREDSSRNVRGNRLPYAPEHLVALSLGYETASGLDVRVGLDHVSDQFADDLNTVAPSADGQLGVLPSHTTYNLSVNFKTPWKGFNVFLSGTNLTDKVYVVNRVNGIQVSRPRTVFAGIEAKF